MTAPRTPHGSTPRPRRVLLASPRSWCAGVNRAVRAVEKALEVYGAPIYVRHEIVHNKHVVQSLEKRGAIFVEHTDEVPEGSTVLFSAHGVAPSVHAEAADRNLTTIDATCPLVTKVHKEALRYAQDDYEILLIGHEDHEEVIGTSGQAPDHIIVIDSPDDVADLSVRDESKVVWLSQTTLSVDETMETVNALKARFPHLTSPPSDDICYAAQNRQAAVKKLAEDAELIIVVGSGNSSNSARLVEVALNAGAPAAHLVDSANEINEAWLDNVATVGLTSGASTPDELVDGVLTWLAQRGYATVEAVKTANETITFSLPQELRRSLRVYHDLGVFRPFGLVAFCWSDWPIPVRR